MDRSAFEAELSRNGFVEIETKVIEPRPVNSAHSHDYTSGAWCWTGTSLVTEGDKPTTYLPGDIFRSRRDNRTPNPSARRAPVFWSGASTNFHVMFSSRHASTTGASVAPDRRRREMSSVSLAWRS